MLKKILLSALLIILVGTAAVFFYLQYLQPTYEGDLKLPGLSDKVEVLYDDYAIPHIYAQNEEDLFYAFGYVHAQDRLFQMELLRRVASGRLSEVFGDKALETDVFFRTLSFEKHAQMALNDRDPNAPFMKAARAYLKGVNHYIHTGKTPIEYTLIGIPKEEFTLLDMEKIVGFMGYTFEAAFQTEAVMTFLKNEYGEAYIKEFADSWPDNFNRIPVDKINAIQAAKSLATIHQNLQKIDNQLVFKPFHGSNGWVISGKKTKSGKPILANDTHIAYAQPSVWYEADLHCPTFSVYGNFIAGTPVPALGHHSNGGWGLTMFENDEADFYQEKLNPANPKQVIYKGQFVNLEERKELIKIKNKADTTILVKKSPHGYLLNGAFKDIKPDADPIALQWVYHLSPSKHMEVFYNLCKAKNVMDARAAVAPLTAPGLNFMWADTEGNIAWWAAGKLPKRPSHVNSFLILDGSSGNDDWQGFEDFDLNPQILNPERGFLYTANNQPEDMGNGPVPGYYVPSNRANRIEELLNTSKNDWTEQDLRTIINDTKTTILPEIIDSLIAHMEVSKLDEDIKKILTILDAWDGEHDLENIAPTIYYRWIYQIYEDGFKDELGEQFFGAFQASHAFKRGMRKFFLNGQSPWWDNIHTKTKETRAEILNASLTKTSKFLKRTLGADEKSWQWQKVHTLEHPHALGQVEALRKFFNVGPLKVPGGRETINNQEFSIDSTGKYLVKVGPALRRIIDFAYPEKAQSVLPTGQSGYFMNKHYDDQAEMFVKGGKRPELTQKDDIERVKIGRLILRPF